MDRLDRIPGTAYQVSRAKDAKEEDQRQRGQQDESSFRRISDWERYFLQARQQQKSLQIPLEAIKEIRYRNSAIHKGTVILHVDLLLNDGTLQTGCLLQHARLEIYGRVQGKKSGDPLPREWFSDLKTLHVTLFQSEPMPEPTTGVRSSAAKYPLVLKDRLQRFLLGLGLADPATGRPRLALAVLYATMALMIAAACVLLVRFLVAGP